MQLGKKLSTINTNVKIAYFISRNLAKLYYKFKPTHIFGPFYKCYLKFHLQNAAYKKPLAKMAF